ncbi:MAG: chemotaxis protein chel [Caulobacteraceae bacterium]|nr:MAG: chemotaxis protein chel [Caulobacteraceae bacterium]
MSAMAPTAAPVTVLPSQTPSADAQRLKIKQAADNYESSFLSVMLAQMFKGVDTEAPFGGGKGEEMFKSFFTDAVAKQVTKSGGIGLSATVEREMLKMQGLQETSHGA